MTASKPLGTALITGASSGIGAVYADRLARRGYDLILVARNRERLDTLATRLAGETGRAIEIVTADLSDKADLGRVEFDYLGVNHLGWLYAVRAEGRDLVEGAGIKHGNKSSNPATNPTTNPTTSPTTEPATNPTSQPTLQADSAPTTAPASQPSTRPIT